MEEFEPEDQFGDENFDDRSYSKRERDFQRELREGPCEDDWEVKTPFVAILPEESDKESGSPLNFKRVYAHHPTVMVLEVSLEDWLVRQKMKEG